MKNFNNIIMVAALTMAPVLANAQWSAVRYDQHNTFKKIYAATANDVFVIGSDQMTYDNFFMRSADGGTTWDSIALTAGNDVFQMSEIHFPDVNNGFIGGRKNNIYQNLQKTTDNGDTWTDVTPDPSIVEPISALYFIDAQQGWATCQQNLYITSNGGASWSTVALSFIPQDLHFVDALTGYACGGYASSAPAVVMKTTDGGQTWTPSLSNTEPNAFANSNLFLNEVDANTIFTSQEWTNKLYRTMDAGATWDTIVCDSVMQIVDFHFESADSGHVLSSMGQLFYTNDAGATWNLAYSAEWGFYGPSVYFNSLNFSQGVGYVCGSSGLIKRFDLDISGVNEQPESVGTMNVFPNPCYQWQTITVETKGMKAGDCSLTIMNTLGQVVHSEKVTVSGNGQQIRLEKMHLNSGMYTVVLAGATQKQTSKFMVE